MSQSFENLLQFCFPLETIKKKIKQKEKGSGLKYETNSPQIERIENRGVEKKHKNTSRHKSLESATALRPATQNTENNPRKKR